MQGDVSRIGGTEAGVLPKYRNDIYQPKKYKFVLDFIKLLFRIQFTLQLYSINFYQNVSKNKFLVYNQHPNLLNKLYSTYPFILVIYISHITLNQMQDTFIQKKLLYKFDKKIQLLFQSIFHLQQNTDNHMVDESESADKKSKYLSKQAILQQIDQLQFLNFKYRTALISAQKDQSSNQAILKKADDQIVKIKTQVQQQSRQLQYSLKCKRNKQEYNHLAESLKNNFEPFQVQNQKLAIVTRQIEQMQKKYEKEVAEYQKKQKCLRLALSALKCVIETENSQHEEENVIINGGLYINQAPVLNGNNRPKVSTVNPALVNGESHGSSREEGEQLQGGQIVY